MGENIRQIMLQLPTVHPHTHTHTTRQTILMHTPRNHPMISSITARKLQAPNTTTNVSMHMDTCTESQSTIHSSNICSPLRCQHTHTQRHTHTQGKEGEEGTPSTPNTAQADLFLLPFVSNESKGPSRPKGLGEEASGLQGITQP